MTTFAAFDLQNYAIFHLLQVFFKKPRFQFFQPIQLFRFPRSFYLCKQGNPTLVQIFMNNQKMCFQTKKFVLDRLFCQINLSNIPAAILGNSAFQHKGIWTSWYLSKNVVTINSDLFSTGLKQEAYSPSFTVYFRLQYHFKWFLIFLCVFLVFDFNFQLCSVINSS